MFGYNIMFLVYHVIKIYGLLLYFFEFSFHKTEKYQLKWSSDDMTNIIYITNIILVHYNNMINEKIIDILLFCLQSDT